jgi:hypothetical protein
MATVVVDSTPSLTASLRVDDEGYLLVSVGGGGSRSASPAQVDKAVGVVQDEIKEVLKGLTSLPTAAQLESLLASRKTALGAKLAAALS